ncbi:hypothetical protein KSAC_33030 (plasmid) [Komagataeibacter saccharivorans]|uniref:hypothetical protein n=1 Tax=Komagataeibacter saccharivorans TaxID=265959 RepID=UPI00104DE611|nr:hypothetical protein [Komagataeibacter saccharivorans]QBL95482.1 hypothetical protein KSAC_33030 [Komagataeibacter saccharivorans]
MNDGDNVFGKAAEPTQTILAQGLNVANLECETDTPIIVGGSVRNARLRAPTVDVLESGIVSGELTADEIIIRGRVEDAVIRAKRFYASATAKVANCTIILEGHTGCGIHKDADLTGEIKLVTAGVAPARPAGSERKVQAEAAPAARPAVSGTSVVGPADKAADNTEEAPASPVDTGTASSSSLPDWDNVDEALRSAATADGHVVLVDPVKDAE